MVGYRANAQGRNLKLHARLTAMMSILPVPEGPRGEDPGSRPRSKCPGIDKQGPVGQFAAEIRRWRSLNPTRARVSPYRGEVHLPQEGREKEVRWQSFPLFERRRPPASAPRFARVLAAKPRALVWHRTGRHIYAQIIDDAAGRTVAAASTLGVSSSGATCRGCGRGRQDRSPRPPRLRACPLSCSTAAVPCFHGRV